MMSTCCSKNVEAWNKHIEKECIKLVIIEKDVCRECCVLSGRGLCDELVTRPEESYRLWCVVVCDLETSWMRRPWPTGGLSRQKNKQVSINISTVHITRTAVSCTRTSYAFWWGHTRAFSVVFGSRRNMRQATFCDSAAHKCASYLWQFSEWPLSRSSVRSRWNAGHFWNTVWCSWLKEMHC